MTIDNVKKLVLFGCDLTKQIASSTADGWQWTDAFSFIDEIAALPGVIKAFPNVKEELADFTPEERQELNAYIQEQFDLPDDKVEAFVEHALQVAISLIALVQEWKQLKNP